MDEINLEVPDMNEKQKEKANQIRGLFNKNHRSNSHYMPLKASFYEGLGLNSSLRQSNA